MAQGASLAGQLEELSSLPLAQPDEALHWPTVANAALAAMTRMMFPTASAENRHGTTLASAIGCRWAWVGAFIGGSSGMKESGRWASGRRMVCRGVHRPSPLPSDYN